jgi:hypothetical protein
MLLIHALGGDVRNVAFRSAKEISFRSAKGDNRSTALSLRTAGWHVLSLRRAWIAPECPSQAQDVPHEKNMAHKTTQVPDAYPVRAHVPFALSFASEIGVECRLWDAVRWCCT